MAWYKKLPGIQLFLLHTVQDNQLRTSLVSEGRQDSGPTDTISSANQGRMPKPREGETMIG